jgi:peroxiredoxin Q/BCP
MYDFRDHQSGPRDKNTVVVGVSMDSAKPYGNLAAKFDLPFTLVANFNKQDVSAYGVYVEKKNYGCSYVGTERTTFLIYEEGKVFRVFSKRR